MAASIATDTRTQGTGSLAIVSPYLTHILAFVPAGLLDQRVSQARLSLSCKTPRLSPTHNWKNIELCHCHGPGQDADMQLYI